MNLSKVSRLSKLPKNVVQAVQYRRIIFRLAVNNFDAKRFLPIFFFLSVSVRKRLVCLHGVCIYAGACAKDFI